MSGNVEQSSLRRIVFCGKKWGKPGQKHKQIFFLFFPLPKGKSISQCFNYCWFWFQLMHIQQLESRLESKALRWGARRLTPRVATRPWSGGPSRSSPLSCFICCKRHGCFPLLLCSAVLKPVLLVESVQLRCPCRSLETPSRREHWGGRWRMGQQVPFCCCVQPWCTHTMSTVLLQSLHPTAGVLGKEGTEKGT